MKNDHKKIETVSEWYKTEGFYQKMIDFEFDEIARFFVGSRLAEIGPADGHHTKKLLEHFSDVTCIEPSKKYSALLKKKFGSKMTVLTQFIEDVTVSKPFDTLLCAHLLEHVPDPIKALQSMSSLMHNSSNLIIIVPNANSIHRLVAVEMGMLTHIKELNELDKRLGHFRVYDNNDLISDIKKAGLSVDFIGGVFLKVLSQGQLEGWSDALVEGFYKVGRLFPLNCADLVVVCSRA